MLPRTSGTPAARLARSARYWRREAQRLEEELAVAKSTTAELEGEFERARFRATERRLWLEIAQKGLTELRGGDNV